MCTSYLVDYENVQYYGLEGVSELLPEDHVYLIYTDNANIMNLDRLNRLQAGLSVIHVEAGKQSLDMHLSTLLGNLIGRESSDEEKYVIISNDTDYDGIISFWRNEFDSEEKVLRRGCINPHLLTNAISKDKARRSLNRHEEISERIQNIFREYAAIDAQGLKRIQFSSLCTLLNNSVAYCIERQHAGKKAKAFLTEDFPDLIRLKYTERVEWAYLAANSERRKSGEKAEELSEELDVPETEQESLSAVDIGPEQNECEVQNPEEEQVPKEERYKRLLMENGIDHAAIEEIVPLVMESKSAIYPRAMLCTRMQHLYGMKLGTKHYKEVRDILKL